MTESTVSPHRSLDKLMRSMLLIAAFTAACTTSRTSVDYVAMAPKTPNAPYHHLLVLGVAPQSSDAYQFERRMVSELRNVNTRAIGFHQSGNNATVTEQAVRDVALRLGVDAVLATRVEYIDPLASVAEERSDVTAQARQGSLVNYFLYDYEEHTLPRKLELHYDVALVTDLYDAKSEDKVYSVKSSTHGGETKMAIILDESHTIAERLRQDGVIQ